VVDRLTQLMRAEADTLDIPHPPIATIVGDGRRARRRRYTVPALAAAAAVAAVGALTVLPGMNSDPGDATVAVHERQAASFSSEQSAAAAKAYTRSGAFAAGSKVYFGDYRKGVEVQDPAVRGLYYTSAGVLVRHGKDYAMDGSSRDGYSLVGTDGSVAGLDLAIGDVSPSTDPTQPYLAYARKGAVDWEIIILDLRTGKPAATVPFEGAFTWGGWDAPPVALSGDRVYVGLDDGTLAVNWRTGETTATSLPASRYPDVNADRYLQVDNDTSGGALNATVQVLDATTGEVLLSLPDVGDRFASLSPDGKHVLVLPYLPMDEDGQVGALDNAVLYDVGTGDSVDLPASPQGGYGWTPDGSVISVDSEALTLCAFETECVTTPLNPEASSNGTIRLGGMVNGS
jgi:hypothetical protein